MPNHEDDLLDGDGLIRPHREVAAYSASYSFCGELRRSPWGDSSQVVVVKRVAEATQDPTALLKKYRSEYITPNQFFTMYDAVCFANRLGMIMNIEMTLTFGCLGIADKDEIRECLETWLERLRAWCRHRQVLCAYVYVWGRPAGCSLHVHLQLHIPLEFQQRFAVWARRTTASMARPAALDPHNQPNLTVRANATVFSQWAWFGYLVQGIHPALQLKGSTRTVAEEAGIRVRPQGEVPWKRVGVSKAISAVARNSARARKEFHPTAVDDCADMWTDWHYRQWQAFQSSKESRALDDVI